MPATSVWKSVAGGPGSQPTPAARGSSFGGAAATEAGWVRCRLAGESDGATGRPFYAGDPLAALAGFWAPVAACWTMPTCEA